MRPQLLMIPLLALALTAALPALAAAQNQTLPFSPGERLEYRLRWERVPAGQATLEVLEPEEVEGVDCQHFRMTAATNSFVDLFYMVRDQVDAYAALDMAHSVLFVQNQLEGSLNRQVRVEFDWDKLQSRRIVRGEHRDTVAIFPATFDELSIGYAFRVQDLVIDVPVTAYVTDGNNCVLGRAVSVAREWVSVPAGDFYAHVVHPELTHMGGVFAQSEDAELTVWITADERRMPVKLRSEVVVGHFTAELTAWQPGLTQDQQLTGRDAGPPPLQLDATANASHRE